jgi:hypothetical protein
MLTTGKIEICLTDRDIVRCLEHAGVRIDSYREGKFERSRAYSFLDGDKDLRLQLLGIMGELAVWQSLDRDPVDYFKFDRRNIGRSWDIEMPDGRRADVKAIDHYESLLIWPYTKNGILAGKQFDIFVLVKRLLRPGWQRLQIQGWITKQRFMSESKEASAGSRLQPGTKYLASAALDACDAAGHPFLSHEPPQPQGTRVAAKSDEDYGPLFRRR